MVRALIIDDEESAVNVVKLLLQKYVIGISEVYTAVGAAEGLKLFSNISRNLFFLMLKCH